MRTKRGASSVNKSRASKPHPGRRGLGLTAHGVTPDALLGALLKVKPEDVAKLEAKEVANRKRRKPRAK